MRLKRRRRLSRSSGSGFSENGSGSTIKQRILPLTRRTNRSVRGCPNKRYVSRQSIAGFGTTGRVLLRFPLHHGQSTECTLPIIESPLIEEPPHPAPTDRLPPCASHPPRAGVRRSRRGPAALLPSEHGNSAKARRARRCS